MMFTRERGRLWKIARRHYFEVVLMPLRNFARFGDGWYEPRREGMNESRWMGASSETILPPLRGPAELGLEIHVPEPLIGSTVTVALNGTVLDQFRPGESRVTRLYDGIATAPGNILTLSISRTIVEEGRPVGLRLHSLSWRSRSSESGNR
jgi:hypothetical protein